MMDAPGFNAWHADVADSPACALIFGRALGLPQCAPGCVPARFVRHLDLLEAGLEQIACQVHLAEPRWHPPGDGPHGSPAVTASRPPLARIRRHCLKAASGGSLN